MGFQFLTEKKRAKRIARERERESSRSQVRCIERISPQNLSDHPRNTEVEYMEMEQLREIWRSCTRDNVEAGGIYIVLNPTADWQPVRIEE